MKLFSFLVLVFSCGLVYPQLTVTGTNNPTVLVQEIVGNGVEITNVTLSCPPGFSGTFQNINSNLGLSHGVLLFTDSTQYAPGPRTGEESMIGGVFCYPGDNDLDSVIQPMIPPSYDACGLEFDLVAEADSLVFDFVFASNEYPGYVCSKFTDGFVFLVTGPKPGGGNYYKQNIAVVPGTSFPISINSINQGSPGYAGNANDCVSLNYSHLYIGNYDTVTPFPQNLYPYIIDSFYINFLGFTVPIQAKIDVVPCASYHLKIVVGEYFDCGAHSAVFIQSVNSTYAFAIDSTYIDYGLPNAIEGCANAVIKVKLNRTLGYDVVAHYATGSTAINGIDYSPLSDSLIIPAGDSFGYIQVQPIVDGVTEGTESVKIYLTYGCSGQIYDSAFVQIEDKELFTVVNDTSKCLYDTIQLYASGALNYQWTPVAELIGSNTANPMCLDTGVYYVTGTTGSCVETDSVIVGIRSFTFTTVLDTAFCAGDIPTLTIDISSLGSYFLADTPILYDANGMSNNNGLFFCSGNQTYFLSVVSNKGCYASDTVFVPATPVFSIDSFTVTDPLCYGDTTGSVALYVTTENGGETYSWSNLQTTNTLTNAGAGVYSVTVTDSKQCTVTGSYTIVQPDSISFSALVDVTGCGANRVVSFNLTAMGSVGGFEYMMYDNTGSFVDSNGTGVFLPPVSGSYVVNVQDANGCYDTVTLISPYYASDSFSLQTIGESCFDAHNGEASISVLSFNNAPYQYALDGGAFNSNTGFDGLSGGAHQIVVRDNVGCDTVFNFSIQNAIQYFLLVEPKDTVIDQGNSVNVSTAVFPNLPSGTTYQWIPCEGLSCCDCANPTMQPVRKQNEYLLVVRYDSCSLTDSITVLVNSNETVFIPNVFTPNSDGSNDRFFVYGANIKQIELKVFNRWGEKVYESNNQFEGWDGLYKGVAAPAGAYVYEVRIVYMGGSDIRRKGSITLLR